MLASTRTPDSPSSELPALKLSAPNGSNSNGQKLYNNNNNNNTTTAETAHIKPASTSPAFKKPKSFKAHRKNAPSMESIPRQTILKALASSKNRPHSPVRRPETLTIDAASNSMENFLDDADNFKTAPLPPQSNGISTNAGSSSGNTGASVNGGATLSPPPSTGKLSLLAPLQSPCFFHENFDDVVNIDKVLEEIVANEDMSHSRMLQTAMGVREVARQLSRRMIKMQIKTIMIVTKARDNTLVYLTRDLAHWLMKTPRYGSDLGVTVYVDEKLKKSKRFDSEGLVREEPRFGDMLKYWTPDLCWTSPETFDLVLTLGGDGTVLFTSWLFQRIVPPILSFSLGSLGFLTNFPFEMYEEHLERLMTVGMRVNMRMRFTCTVYRNKGGHMEEAEQFEVLNELVIDRGPSPYVSNLELYGDDELLTVVQADGCIFSTPTGSTAYSLSAGGSLVHPDIPAILLTPICPHTLSFRPMLLSDSMLLRVTVPTTSRATAYCAFDGKGRLELKQGDHVTIVASQYPFPTVLSSRTEWFESLARTLRWNTRGAQQKAWDGGSAGRRTRSAGNGSGDGENGNHAGRDSGVGSEVGEEDREESVEELEEGFDIDVDSAVYSDHLGSNSPLKRALQLM